jgi:SAM-dependent MidA family methyltransferase
MTSYENPLLPLIAQEIKAQGGMIPFRRFMELALYHPDHGYYASGLARIGKNGDFFTSVSVGRIYGSLLASVCREVWERMDRPAEFTIVEQGANDGTMSGDILSVIMTSDQAFLEALRYVIVEPFPLNVEKQKSKLGVFPKIVWVKDPEELPEFTGIHLSNELLDAFPVNSLRWNGSNWMEECVSLDMDSMPCWTGRPITDAELLAAADRLPKNLPEGFRLETNPGMTSWLGGIFRKMHRGIVLTVDYGQAGEDRYAPHRADGTLLAYRNHQRFDNPLPEPGERDISAQVDFTELARSAVGTGFSILGYSDQHHFLVGAAEPWLRTLGDWAPEHGKDLRALQTLLNPGTMGRQFKAIALGKDFPATPSLACFRHQRPGTEAL